MSTKKNSLGDNEVTGSMSGQKQYNSPQAEYPAAVWLLGQKL